MLWLQGRSTPGISLSFGHGTSLTDGAGMIVMESHCVVRGQTRSSQTALVNTDENVEYKIAMFLKSTPIR